MDFELVLYGGVIVCLIGLIVFWGSKGQTSEELAKKISLLCEALYQVGYDEQKAGVSQRVWGEGLDLKDSFGQIALQAGQKAFLSGYQDAAEGNPSLSEQISKSRERQLEILEEMSTLLRSVQASL